MATRDGEEYKQKRGISETPVSQSESYKNETENGRRKNYLRDLSKPYLL